MIGFANVSFGRAVAKLGRESGVTGAHLPQLVVSCVRFPCNVPDLVHRNLYVHVRGRALLGVDMERLLEDRALPAHLAREAQARVRSTLSISGQAIRSA